MKPYDLTSLYEFLDELGLGNRGVGSHLFRLHVPLLDYPKLHKDVDKYSIWEVDTFYWDPGAFEAWQRGEVILNHTICPVALRMRKEKLVQYLSCAKTHKYTDYMDYLKDSEEIYSEMIKVSEKIEKEGVLKPGYLYSEGVADGMATYVVTKVTKANVFLEHRSFVDGYKSPWLGLGDKVPLSKFMQISRFGRGSLFKVNT